MALLLTRERRRESKRSRAAHPPDLTTGQQTTGYLRWLIINLKIRLEESFRSKTHQAPCGHPPTQTHVASLVLAARKLSTCFTRSDICLRTVPPLVGPARFLSRIPRLPLYLHIRVRRSNGDKLDLVVFATKPHVAPVHTEPEQRNTGSFGSAHRARISADRGSRRGVRVAFKSSSIFFHSSGCITHSYEGQECLSHHRFLLITIALVKASLRIPQGSREKREDAFYSIFTCH